MRSLVCSSLILAACASTPAPPVAAPADPALPAVQPTPAFVDAMGELAFMRGVWAGPATGIDRDGKSYKVTQTERMGPMIGGDIVVIEGRGYKDDNTTGFNAFAVVSWNPHSEKYEMRSYAQGLVGTFELQLTGDGYVWEIPAGADGVIRYTAHVTGDQWHEVGEYVAAGKPTVQIFEMTLKRVGQTDWPLGTPVPPRLGR